MAEPIDPVLKRDFMLREYDALQVKQKYCFEDLARTEAYVSLAIGAMFAWLSLNIGPGSAVGPIFFAIPAALACLGAWRQYVRYRYINRLGAYLRAIEQQIYGDPLSDDAPHGFERFENGNGGRKLRRAIFWVLLIALTSAFAGYSMIVDCPELDGQCLVQGSVEAP